MVKLRSVIKYFNEELRVTSIYTDSFPNNIYLPPLWRFLKIMPLVSIPAASFCWWVIGFFPHQRSLEHLASVHYLPSEMHLPSTASPAHLITRINQGTSSHSPTASANGLHGTMTIYTREESIAEGDTGALVTSADSAAPADWTTDSPGKILCRKGVCCQESQHFFLMWKYKK